MKKEFILSLSIVTPMMLIGLSADAANVYNPNNSLGNVFYDSQTSVRNSQLDEGYAKLFRDREQRSAYRASKQTHDFDLSEPIPVATKKTKKAKSTPRIAPQPAQQGYRQQIQPQPYQPYRTQNQQPYYGYQAPQQNYYNNSQLDYSSYEYEDDYPNHCCHHHWEAADAQQYWHVDSKTGQRKYQYYPDWRTYKRQARGL